VAFIARPWTGELAWGREKDVSMDHFLLSPKSSPRFRQTFAFRDDVDLQLEQKRLVESFSPLSKKGGSQVCPDTPFVSSFKPYHSSTLLPKRKLTNLLSSSKNGCAEGELSSPAGLRALDPGDLNQARLTLPSLQH